MRRRDELVEVETVQGGYKVIHALEAVRYHPEALVLLLRDFFHESPRGLIVDTAEAGCQTTDDLIWLFAVYRLLQPTGGKLILVHAPIRKLKEVAFDTLPGVFICHNLESAIRTLSGESAEQE